MLSFTECLVVALLIYFSLSFTWQPPTTVDLIVANGYPLQSFDIETEQGYILTVYRIPFGRNHSQNVKRPPILLQHGLLCSSACWVISEPSKSLAYRLADIGFDVWLNNDRGTIYSRKHRNITASSEFWDYSFEELGEYDLPSVVDFILNITNETKLSFVGHSQGTLQFFIMATTRPEYNEKIRVASLLAPVFAIKDQKGIFPTFIKHVSNFAEMAGIKYVLERGYFLHLLGHSICHENSIFNSICAHLFFAISGYSYQQFNLTQIKIITDHCPSGVSTKQLKHFSQIKQNGNKLLKYDYGKEKNLLKYSSPLPPPYELKNITSPIFIYYSEGDYLVPPTGVREIIRSLPHAKAHQISCKEFNHHDFIWAIDINLLLNDLLIDQIINYNKEINILAFNKENNILKQ